MDIPTYSTIIIKLLTLFDQVLKDFVYNGYSALAHHLAAPFGAACVLYIIILGVSISQGWVRLSFANFVKVVFKISLIYCFAFSWGNFSYYIVKGIEGSAGQIGDWLVNATPVPLPHFAGEGIDGAMQSIMIEVTKIGAWTWDQGSAFHDWGPFFTALLIWFSGYAALILALIETLIAKMMLAILFTTAPLFISFTLFKTTHGWFDKWLGAIAGFSFFLILIPAAVTLILSFIQWVVAAQYADKAVHMRLVGFLPILVVSALGVLLVIKVTNYAHSFGGSISTASGSSLLAGMVGGAIGSAMSFHGRSKQAVKGAAGGAGMMIKAADWAMTGGKGRQAFNAIKDKLRGG